MIEPTNWKGVSIVKKIDTPFLMLTCGRWGARRPVDVCFAPTGAERRTTPLRKGHKTNCFSSKKVGYKMGYKKSVKACRNATFKIR